MFGKLNLNKLTVSSLQSVKGGNEVPALPGESDDTKCNSMNTTLTRITRCCHGETTNWKCTS